MQVMCTQRCYAGSVLCEEAKQYEYDGPPNRHLRPVKPEDLEGWNPPIPQKRTPPAATLDAATTVRLAQLEADNARLKAAIAEIQAAVAARAAAEGSGPVKRSRIKR